MQAEKRRKDGRLPMTDYPRENQEVHSGVAEGGIYGILSEDVRSGSGREQASVVLTRGKHAVTDSRISTTVKEVVSAGREVIVAVQICSSEPKTGSSSSIGWVHLNLELIFCIDRT